MKRYITLIIIGVLMLTGCASAGKAVDDNDSEAADKNVAVETPVSDEIGAEEAASGKSEQPVSDEIRVEEAASGKSEQTSEAGGAEKTDQEEPVEAGHADMDAQLQLIAESSDLWYADSEYEEWWYAVTDLDRDSSLEIIAASMQGSGLYTGFSIYEINEDRTGLNLLPDTLEQGKSGPDLIVDSAQTVEQDGSVYYYFEDVLRISPAEHLVTKEILSLENGQVVIRPIASAHTGPEFDENGEPKADSMVEEYFDSSNRKISREEFDSLIAVPDGCETIGFGWTNLSDDISLEALRESFEKFKLVK